MNAIFSDGLGVMQSVRIPPTESRLNVEDSTMAIPSYQELMLSLLKVAADGSEHRMREAIKSLADEFRLSEPERTALLPSGNVIFDNRVHWARTYLSKAGLIQPTKWGYFQITDSGKAVLADEPSTIDVDFLKQFPTFLEYYSGKKPSDEGQETEESEESRETPSEKPEELLARGYLKLRKQLEFDILARIKSSSPDFFERLVVRVLTSMGYGGSLADAGKAVGKSGDGGIDGVIKEDKLGLDQIYIQAKRWTTPQSGVPRFSNLSEPYMVRGRGRASLSRPLASPKTQKTMRTVSKSK